uniref:EOG090X00I4 n=1 Tax=Lynceus sp. MCZ IZ 141354 TaxID=1930659 RepID=A0A9N6ZEF2_9CRUS|nr:EOG090X00I4 [Lynceus sp. MCZ IZ 141354]
MNNEDDEEDWPPFKKIGIFDPYSDDPRLAVKKLSFCPLSGRLIVGGTAGQVIVAELSAEASEASLPLIAVNIVSDCDSFVWKGHEKLAARAGVLKQGTGYQAKSVVQLHPPAAITALTLHSDWSLVAVGTAHGLALYDYVQKKAVTSKCTLNPSDAANAVGDHPMSRRKSFKKSLRESFRRLRKGRSQRAGVTKTNSAPASTPQGSDAASVVADAKPVERQIEARASDDGLGSMVKCILLIRTYIIAQSQNTNPTLWAGLNNGTVYVFNLVIPGGERRQNEPVAAILAKEVQLKHKAPVVSMSIIDANCTAVTETPEVQGAKEFPSPHRVVISSEEQIKVFTLPNIKPYGKYKLTAYTGSQVRRVAVLPFISSSDANYKENALTVLTNQGDFHILSLPELKRQMHAECIKREDIYGNSSLVFTRHGEAFYLHSSSELQRLSLTTCNYLQLKCQLLVETEDPVPAAKPDPVTPVKENDKDSKIDGELKKDEKENHAEKEKAVEKVTNAVTSTPVKDQNSSFTAPPGVNISMDHDVTETSISDITIDSVKDHLALEERVVEVKTERRVQESVTVVKTQTTILSTEIVNSEGTVSSFTATSQNREASVMLNNFSSNDAPLAKGEDSESATTEE